MRGLHGFWCLSVTGVIFQLATYVGFSLMITGASCLLPPPACEDACAVQYVLELGCLQSKDEVCRDTVLYLRE